MPSPLNRHGMGVRTDYPTPRVPPREDPAREPKANTSAMAATFEAASAKNKLKGVSTAQAKTLETKFNSSSAQTENLSAGRVGASITGMVVNGELFVRTKPVRPGATPKWMSAGPLEGAPKPKETDKPDKPNGWGPKPKSLESRAQKTLTERMGLLSNPDFALKASELAEVKKGIADGDFQVVNATPKGLAGVGFTGYVSEGMLVVEKKGVHPGAKSTFYLLGPLVD